MHDGHQRLIDEARLEAIGRLQRFEVQGLAFRGDAIAASLDMAKSVLPGAFNPLHQGHREMARVAEQWLGPDNRAVLAYEPA